MFKNKYLKYKNKYLNLKLKQKNNKIGGDFIINNNDIIIQPCKNGEYSSINIKTKEVQHEYSKTICNNIIEDLKDKQSNYKILLLGVALGGMIIHLFDKLQNIHITGVDISDENFDFVYQHSSTDKLLLIKDNAEEFIKKNSNDRYDIIICDIFDNINIPKFVFSNDFLNNINKKLNNNGKFFINIIQKNNININDFEKILNNIFLNCNISNKNLYNDGNIICIVKC